MASQKNAKVFEKIELPKRSEPRYLIAASHRGQRVDEIKAQTLRIP
jgi:hypothetical protein